MNAVSIHFPRYLLPFDFLDELRQLFDEWAFARTHSCC